MEFTVRGEVPGKSNPVILLFLFWNMNCKITIQMAVIVVVPVSKQERHLMS
jgi:hypothetical protein